MLLLSCIVSLLNNLFCVQWIYVSQTGTAGTNMTLTFPIKFTSTNYVLSYNAIHNNEYQSSYGQTSNKTISNCALQRAHEPFHVVIIGY